MEVLHLKILVPALAFVGKSFLVSLELEPFLLHGFWRSSTSNKRFETFKQNYTYNKKYS